VVIREQREFKVRLALLVVRKVPLEFKVPQEFKEILASKG